ncbi:hypothetical protein [Desulfofundulus thermocisternus]|uniref:hypothetical protein n=1 Tax=Desulfofundulus thermocisternus TaxID=42471 RepID=UPI00217EB3E6|nr:hypothetical protein [Desulfofundulus thermocisternus]MCS5695733.1 hypothetical protein [Desulfofundulus thermocisternus]
MEKEERQPYFLGFFIFMLILMVEGCSQPESYPKTITAPAVIQLTQKTIHKVDSDPYKYFYFPQISQVIGGNINGELVGFLWERAEKPQQLRALYIIDPAQKKATKIAEPQPGFEIHTAALDDRYVAWVEKNKVRWKLCLLNKKAKSIKIIDQGKYFTEAGTDYPSVALYNGILVYNVSFKDKTKVMLSQIVAQDLNTGRKMILGEVTGTEQYLGPPSIHEDNVVWHCGEWTKEMKAEVYLYNLTDHKIQQLSHDTPAITPTIWGKYVVWSTYSSKVPETKNIVLYNLATGTRTFLTEAVPSQRLEYWRPTISHGVVTWNTNKPDHELVVFLAATGERRQLKIKGEQIGVHGSWLTWRHASNGPGTFLLTLSNFLPALDLTGFSPEKAFSRPPFTLDVVLDRSKLVRLSPPEAIALYLEAAKEKRYDLLEVLLADNTGLAGNETYLTDIRRDQSKLISYLVSRDYLIEGDKAYVCILEKKIWRPAGEVMVFEKPVIFHLTKKKDIWKVDQLAAQ